MVGFPESGFPTASTMASCTVVLLMLNSLAIARSLIPSLCFSRIAASRFSFSCTERAGGEISGLAHFPDSGFCASASSGRPRVSRSDTVMWRNPLFYSTTSGRPRAPPKAVGAFRGRPRGPFRFSLIQDFPEPEGGTSGPLPVLGRSHFRKRKDGPRVFFLFCRKGISGNARRDLGGCPNVVPAFGDPPSGGPKMCSPRLGPPQDGPRAVLKHMAWFRTTSRRTLGSLNVVSAFGDPSGCAKSRWGVSLPPFRISLCIGATG